MNHYRDTAIIASYLPKAAVREPCAPADGRTTWSEAEGSLACSSKFFNLQSSYKSLCARGNGGCLPLGLVKMHDMLSSSGSAFCNRRMCTLLESRF